MKRSMKWFPAPDHLCPTLGRKNFGVRMRIWSPPKEAVSDDTNSIQDEPWWKCTVGGGALWVSVTEGTAEESTGLEAGPVSW